LGGMEWRRSGKREWEWRRNRRTGVEEKWEEGNGEGVGGREWRRSGRKGVEEEWEDVSEEEWEDRRGGGTGGR
jgi:hypothetical protein